jgi:hypothetical protein
MGDVHHLSVSMRRGKGSLTGEVGGEVLKVYTKRKVAVGGERGIGEGRPIVSRFSFEETRGKSQVQFICSLYSVPLNGVKQVLHHNKGKLHVSRLKKCGASLEHGVRDFADEVKVGENLPFVKNSRPGQSVMGGKITEVKESSSSCIILSGHEA